eukprot:529082_1
MSKIGKKTCAYICVELGLPVVVDTSTSKKLTSNRTTLQHALHYTFLGSEDMYDKLVETDRDIKNGKIKIDKAFEQARTQWESKGPYMHWEKGDYSKIWKQIDFVKARKKNRQGKASKKGLSDKNTNSTATITNPTATITNSTATITNSTATIT